MSKSDNDNPCKTKEKPFWNHVNTDDYEEENEYKHQAPSFFKYLFNMCRSWLIVIIEVHILIGFILLVLYMWKGVLVFN
ncbi:hypothetical protein ACWB3A_18885 [Acinetobacter baumannii]|uniref:Uncharacterized protein n=3 Tax=Acinetobacter TaxID=469 RepID=A0A6G5PMH8_ACIBA|nr:MULTISPECIES: hypothetical protein [Acinetobacter]AYA67178.1 hypothetical protein CDG62_01780 [Acinetobacter sp. WCHA55]MCE6238544.1 hypothetical protein [Acinetobacter pittii]MCE6693296.1 hypothetical protein [Acinetobacter pittii]MCE6700747.1 hypothetical protein [Acinetobacter pittii]MCK7610306.1 hypothetical protein [Acinetobacter portensis]